MIDDSKESMPGMEANNLPHNVSLEDAIDISHLLDWSGYCAVDWSLALETPIEPVTRVISEADVPDNAGRLSEVTLASHSSS